MHTLIFLLPSFDTRAKQNTEWDIQMTDINHETQAENEATKIDECAYKAQRPRIATTMASAEPLTGPRPGSTDAAAPVLLLLPPCENPTWESPPTVCPPPDEAPSVDPATGAAAVVASARLPPPGFPPGTMATD
jgi:hypothetical protein